MGKKLYVGSLPYSFSEGQLVELFSQYGAVESGKVISDNPKAVEDFKAGKEASLKFLIGMAMRETRGKANPQVVEGMIKEMLK